MMGERPYYEDPWLRWLYATMEGEYLSRQWRNERDAKPKQHRVNGRIIDQKGGVR
jgi:hypothetical protein